MRALIVDDEVQARARLRRLLAAFTDIDVVGEAGDGVEALALVATLAPDVLFVDVQMPEVSGLDLVASLPDADLSPQLLRPAPAVVFVTAHDRYALPAFDAAAVDYLLKPVDPERLARSVQRLRFRHRGGHSRSVAAGPQHLLVTDRGHTHVVPVAEIGWLQAADNYVSVHTTHRVWLLRRTLSGLLADLGGSFQRVHRSAAVAVAQVAQVQASHKGDATVRLKDGAEVPCSRAYRAALVQRL